MLFISVAKEPQVDEKQYERRDQTTRNQVINGFHQSSHQWYDICILQLLLIFCSHDDQDIEQ